MFRRLLERRLQTAYSSSGSTTGVALNKRLWCLRGSSDQPATYLADESTLNGRYVRLTDETSIGATARLPQPGRCIDFNGTSSVVTYTYAGLLDSANDYTIAVRFRAKTVGGALLSTLDGSGDGIEMRLSSGQLVLESNGVTVSGGSFTANKWYTIAMGVSASNTVTVYSCDHATNVKTKIVDASAFAGSASSGNTLSVGNDGTDNWYEGQMSMLLVYGDACRTDEELQGICDSNVPEGHDLLSWYEDGGGTKHWDASGTGWHGTGANVSHVADGTNDVYSRQNEYGYTAGNGSNGASIGQYIPRVESTVFFSGSTFDQFDANLGAIQYKGKVPYGPIVSKPVITLNGSNEYLQIGTIGSDVTRVVMTLRFLQDNQVILSLNGSPNGLRVTSGVLDYDGTSVGAIVDGVTLSAANAGAALNDNQWHRIDVTLPFNAGADNVRVGNNFSAYGNIAMADLQFHGSFTSHYPITEQSGQTVYDTGFAGAHGQLISANLGTVWGTLAGFGGHIEQYGARDESGVYVPGRDGTTAANGLPVNVGPRKLVGSSVLDLTGGEANSPMARQMAAYIDTTYSVGDGDSTGLGVGVRFAVVASDGDSDVIVVLPPAEAGQIPLFGELNA